MLAIRATTPDSQAPRRPAGATRVIEETVGSPLEGAFPEAAHLRGDTGAAADRMGCRCPEYCERDHANE